MKYSIKKFDKEGFCKKLIHFFDVAEEIAKET